MIISPPFLPMQGANQNDDSWLDAAMTQPSSRLANTQAPEGSFPLSNKLEWHTGMHLQGTAGADGHTPVRALADGEVIFVSQPKAANNTATDPQNFNPFGDSATWTDNGCVIIKHTTEIGANGQLATALVYYSLYMHLNGIGRITPSGQTAARRLQVGDRVWRKDEVGRAGQIYGHAGQVHLEICMDETHLTQLIGRAPAWVDPANIPAPTADGRIDAVFGAIWFYLPANTPTATAQPATHLQGASPSMLGQALWIKLRYALGECLIESYDHTGNRVGILPRQADVEYNLYTEATRRHNALPQANQAQSSPSGWYELLRFGRNLGRGPAPTDKDPLPANAAHWRQIPGPGGQPVWADLNAQGSYKFSDADFLPIQGWHFINDDSSPNDQRCDSNHLKHLIADPDTNNAQRMELDQLARRLGNPDVAGKLKRMVCNFPSEWDQTTIATRYAFVQQLEPFQQNPDAWAVQEAHFKSISFPNLPAEYTAATWRFQPREFIGYMRKCGWLSRDEMYQLFPKTAMRPAGKNKWVSEAVRPDKPVLLQAITSYAPSLNKTCRKYGIVTPLRMAAFYANAMQETMWFGKLHEGNSTVRYAPWDGRGFLQLTWPVNYIKYWNFAGKTVSAQLEQTLAAAQKAADQQGTNAPLNVVEAQIPATMKLWRTNIGSGNYPEESADSAGAYWAWSQAAAPADQYSANVRKTERVGSKPHAYYSSDGMGNVAATVNFGHRSTKYLHVNGIVARFQAYVACQMALLDNPSFPDAQGKSQPIPEDYIQRRP